MNKRDKYKNKNTFNFHDSVNETYEWYTPKYIIDALNYTIDLDPASSKNANSIIQANNYFTEHDNGLIQNWYGNVWLNPPYGNQVPIWLEKSLNEIKQNNINIIILLFSRTDTNWFHNFAVKFDQICFIKGRISFIQAKTMTTINPSGAGSILISSGNIANNCVLNSGLGYCVNTGDNNVKNTKTINN